MLGLFPDLDTVSMLTTKYIKNPRGDTQQACNVKIGNWHEAIVTRGPVSRQSVQQTC